MQATRVLILTSSTGGGHDMRARSLRQWMELPENRAGWEVRIHQALEETHGIYRFGVWLYNWIQRTWPALHHIYFNALELMETTQRSSSMLGRKRFAAVLREFRPQLVVSTHCHLNHAFFSAAREILGREKVRCVTYCGEMHGGYGFARTWVNPAADRFIAAVDRCAEAARAARMPSDRTSIGGFLLHPDFFQPVEPNQRKDILNDLGLETNRYTLLLATGANGANNHLACLRALDREGLGIQVIALCGNDARAKEALERYQPITAGLTVRALGYTEDMPRLLAAASTVFARPGTGTTSESIARQCPIVFNAIGGIMPQEIITEKFAREREIWSGTVRSPADLPTAIRPLLEAGRRAAIRERMSRINEDLSPETILGLLREEAGQIAPKLTPRPDAPPRPSSLPPRPAPIS